MTFQQALDILSRRRQIQDEADDPHTGADLVLEAAHLVTVEVRQYCRTDIEGLGDWLENGEYTGSETPQSIAAEWDRAGI